MSENVKQTGFETGWISPDYTESQVVTLDKKTVGDNRCVCIYQDAPEIDAYKILRTQIEQRTMEKGWNVIMITSVLPGEGKTLTAINLAMVFAREFKHTVLLVDADLKEQNIHRYMGFEGKLGLIDYILDGRPLKDLIVWPRIEKLTVISGSRTIQDSTELLGSPRMGKLVSEMKARYTDRYVFFDVPSVLNRSDTMAFAPFVDGIVLLVEAGKTKIEDVQKTLEVLPQDRILGFVMNRVPSRS